MYQSRYSLEREIKTLEADESSRKTSSWNKISFPSENDLFVILDSYKCPKSKKLTIPLPVGSVL